MPNILVQYPTGHRTRIEIAPNKTLSKALDSACAQKSLDPSKYSFVHNGRPVDLATTFRLSGLVNNTTLDLVAIDESLMSTTKSDVRLCFRLNDGFRAVWSGCCNTPLWLILQQLSKDQSPVAELLNSVTERSDQSVAVVYLQEQITGASSLQSTTPGDLGIRCGSALFQLVLVDKPQSVGDEAAFSAFQEQPVSCTTVPSGGAVEEVCSPTQMNENPTPTVAARMNEGPVPTEAARMNEDPVPMESAPSETLATGFASPFSVFAERPTQSVFGQPDKPATVTPMDQEPQTLGSLFGISLEPSSSFGQPRPCTNETNMDYQFANFRFPSETAGVDLKSQWSEDEAVGKEFKVDRQLVAFRRPLVVDSVNNLTTDELPDSFFEHTEGDLRKLLEECHRTWSSGEPLKTAAMRKTAREKLYARYPRAVIQFIWSDGVNLQACFNPFEKVHCLYEFVKMQLQDSQLNFDLYTTPPKLVLKDMKINLIEANLVPMSKVYFSAQSNKAMDVLNPELIACASTENAFEAANVVSSWMKRAAQQASEKHSARPTTSSTAIQSTTGTPTNGPTSQPKWLKLSK